MEMTFPLFSHLALQKGILKVDLGRDISPEALVRGERRQHMDMIATGRLAVRNDGRCFFVSTRWPLSRIAKQTDYRVLVYELLEKRNSSFLLSYAYFFFNLE